MYFANAAASPASPVFSMGIISVYDHCKRKQWQIYSAWESVCEKLNQRIFFHGIIHMSVFRVFFIELSKIHILFEIPSTSNLVVVRCVVGVFVEEMRSFGSNCVVCWVNVTEKSSLVCLNV